MNGPERREAIQRELTRLLGDDHPHAPDCGCDLVWTNEAGCVGLAASAVLDLLQGAGLLFWGGWPDPQIPEDEADLEFTALRLTAESWWAIPVDAVNAPGLVAYWRAVNVLGVRGPAGGMLDAGGLTPRQRAALLEVARDIVRKLEEEAETNDGDSGGDPPKEAP